LLELMSKGALVCAALSFLFCLPAFLGLGLGYVTCRMAEADLAVMWAGSLDPRGREQTLAAHARAIRATRLSVFGPFLTAMLWACLAVGYALLSVIIPELAATDHIP
jgi:hypothetical protein